MNERRIIIGLLVIVVCMNVVGGVFLVLQQKKINSLSYNEKSNPDQAATSLQAATTPSVNPDVQAKINDQQFQNTIDGQKQVNGIIKSISNGIIVIDAQVENFDALKNSGAIDPTKIVFEQKEINVKIDSSTKFNNTEQSSLKQGDIILVQSTDSVYDKNDITAQVISYITPPAVSQVSQSNSAKTPIPSQVPHGN